MSVPNLFPEGFKRALAAIYSREPVTDAERAEHARLVALQAARDDAARRNPPNPKARG